MVRGAAVFYGGNHYVLLHAPRAVQTVLYLRLRPRISSCTCYVVMPRQGEIFQGIVKRRQRIDEQKQHIYIARPVFCAVLFDFYCDSALHSE